MSTIASVVEHKPGLLEKMGARFSIAPERMLPTLKATAFKSGGDISNEQMIALLVVADQYSLNPWTKEIYAFPDKRGGIVPVVGVDGWSRIINSHPEFDGMSYEYSENLIESAEHKPCPEWVRCIIHRKDRTHPISVEEYFDECYRPPMGQNRISGPWQSHTKRFLRHKATIQCARLAFGFVGIFDPDEAERIVEAEVVTHPRSTSVTQAVIEESGCDADPIKADEYAASLKSAVFNQDDPAILELYEEMDSDMQLAVHSKLQSEDRTYIKNVRRPENK